MINHDYSKTCSNVVKHLTVYVKFWAIFSNFSDQFYNFGIICIISSPISDHKDTKDFIFRNKIWKSCQNTSFCWFQIHSDVKYWSIEAEPQWKWSSRKQCKKNQDWALAVVDLPWFMANCERQVLEITVIN